MAGRSATLVIQVLADTAKAQQGVKVFGKTIDSGMIAKGAAVAGAFVAAGAAIFKMTKAAAADAAEQDRLMAAYKATGAATGDYAASIDEAIAAGQALAFTDTEIRDALVPLIGATGDAQQANKDLALAQDIARLKGIPLETAAKAIAKAHGGTATSLAKLVEVNAKGLTATEVLTAAQAKAAGQAETYGKTAAGQSAAMTIGFDELTESIGGAFLPILTALLPVVMRVIKVLQGVAKWVSENTGLTLVIVGVIGALVAIIATASAVTKVYSAIQALAAAKTAIWTAAQWLLNTALAANPIGIVVLAIAALVAGLVLAYQKSATFRRIVDAAFRFVMDTVRTVVRFITDAWAGLTDILTAPFDALMDLIGSVQGGIGSVIDLLPGGKAAPAGMAPPAAPRVGARAAAPAGGSVPSGSLPAAAAGAPLHVTLTHRIDDPAGILAGLPGGARAVADLLNRGADASGLFRNLQQAAGVR